MRKRSINIAWNYEINAIIKSIGVRLPKGFSFNLEYEGRSTEWIYNHLKENK